MMVWRMERVPRGYAVNLGTSVEGLIITLIVWILIVRLYPLPYSPPSSSGRASLQTLMRNIPSLSPTLSLVVLVCELLQSMVARPLGKLQNGANLLHCLCKYHLHSTHSILSFWKGLVARCLQNPKDHVPNKV